MPLHAFVLLFFFQCFSGVGPTRAFRLSGTPKILRLVFYFLVWWFPLITSISSFLDDTVISYHWNYKYSEDAEYRHFWSYLFSPHPLQILENLFPLPLPCSWYCCCYSPELVFRTMTDYWLHTGALEFTYNYTISSWHIVLSLSFTGSTKHFVNFSYLCLLYKRRQWNTPNLDILGLHNCFYQLEIPASLVWNQGL